MAIKDKLTEEFLKALDEIETVLLVLLFKRNSSLEKGYGYFIEFRRENNTSVEFLFGPSDWNIEMIIYTLKGKFAFKDLLKIPELNMWVNDNRYKQVNGRKVKNELLWFVELLTVSLPLVE
jgi:hypothetical protein